MKLFSLKNEAPPQSLNTDEFKVSLVLIKIKIYK